jgi:transcriptional/translational regulatory protein YebC/TACO1
MAAAVARGQGQSATGEALESLTLEVIIPPSIAMVVDIETDNKKRALSDLRSTVNRNGGTVTPTAYLFTRKGRVQFAKDENGLGVDEVLDDAIEAGAEDVEVDEDGSIVLWTQSNNTAAAAAALSKSHGLKAESSDIIWDANEDTMVPLESEEQFMSLKRLVDALQENQSVQGVYVNVLQGNISDEAWSELGEKLGA